MVPREGIQFSSFHLKKHHATDLIKFSRKFLSGKNRKVSCFLGTVILCAFINGLYRLWQSEKAMCDYGVLRTAFLDHDNISDRNLRIRGLGLQKSAVRPVTCSRPRDHLTPILHDLHWLVRVKLKVLLVTCYCLQSTAPVFSRDIVHNSYSSLPPPLQNLAKLARQLICGSHG